MSEQAPSPPTRRRGFWPVVAAVAAVLLIGVGVAIGLLLQRDAKTELDVLLPDGSSLKDYAASQAALPPCADVFAPGMVIDDAKALAGCRDPRGVIRGGGYHTCLDGRHLFTMDLNSGGQPGFGFSGEPFKATAGDSWMDPGYGPAYDECYGKTTG